MMIWKSLVLTILAACLQVLIFPNFGFAPLAWIMLLPLLAAFESRGVLASFFLGCLFGLIMAGGITTWLYYSVVHYFSVKPLLGVVFVVAVWHFYAANYTGLFGALMAVCRPLVQRRVGVLLVPCFWVACEILRANWIAEDPWGLLGYSQYRVLPLIQVADITGVYGISFLVALGSVALYRVLVALFKKGGDPGLSSWTGRDWGISVFLPCVLIGSAFLYGHVRLDEYTAAIKGKDGIRVASVQGNIKREYRWRSIYYGKNLSKYIRMSKKPEVREADLVVWPENAVNFHPDRDSMYLKFITRSMANPSRILLTGAPHMVKPGESGTVGNFNSAYRITADGIQEIYNKMRLMPYSERKPSWLRKTLKSPGEAPSAFVAGEEYTVFSLPDSRFSTPICFEMVYPELIRGFVRNGAQFLVNISNDSWFGKGAGPDQHLIFSTIRAVENRRYVVRTANTGISAFVAPTGEILSRTELDQDAVLCGDVVPLEEMTLYTRRGDLFAIACSLVTLFSVLACVFRKSPASD